MSILPPYHGLLDLQLSLTRYIGFRASDKYHFNSNFFEPIISIITSLAPQDEGHLLKLAACLSLLPAVYSIPVTETGALVTRNTTKAQDPWNRVLFWKSPNRDCSGETTQNLDYVYKADGTSQGCLHFNTNMPNGGHYTSAFADDSGPFGIWVYEKDNCQGHSCYLSVSLKEKQQGKAPACCNMQKGVFGSFQIL
jgi:hypothetical protein